MMIVWHIKIHNVLLLLLLLLQLHFININYIKLHPIKLSNFISKLYIHGYNYYDTISILYRK